MPHKIHISLFKPSICRVHGEAQTVEPPELAGPGGAAVGPASVPQRLQSQLFFPSVAPAMILSSLAVGVRIVLTALLQDPA